MFVGSINIENIENNFSIQLNQSPFFDIFIESLQFPFKKNFFANNIETLDNYIKTKNFSIYTAEKLLFSLFNQITILHEKSISISFLELSDILVIDNKYFYICNLNKFYKLDENNNILINEVYNKKTPYLSPFFVNNNYIPFYSHCNDFYFNLALIILDCIRKTNYLFSNLSNEDILNYYRYTKTYNTLKICLSDDIINRQFIIF